MITEPPYLADQARAVAAITALCAEARRPGSATSDTLTQGLAASSGLHPHVIAAMIAQFGRGWHGAAIARALRAARLRGEPAPAGRVAVVAPANVPAAAWQAMLEPLLAGNRVRVRPSAREPLAVHNLLAALRAIDAAVADRVELAPSSHADRAAWQRFLSDAQVLTLQGDDTAVAAVRRLVGELGFGGQLRLHGEARSVAVIDAIAWRAHGQRTARALARDALQVDGRGCMSLRSVLFVGLAPGELHAAHRLVADALGRAARALPPGTVPPSISARVAWLAETLDAEVGAVPGLLLARRQDGWLATAPAAADLGEAWPGPGARCLTAVNVADIPAAAALLARLGAPLSTLAWAGAPDQRQRLTQLLGPVRICAPGQMQAPRPDDLHDGWLPLQGFAAPPG